MTSNRATIEATGNTVRGPWDDTLRPALPVAVPATDPRLELSEHALVVASHNAFPIVATRKNRRDNLGIAAGGAIALVLGCATFVSLSSSRNGLATSPATPAVSSVSQGQQGLPAPGPTAGNPVVGAPAAPTPVPQPNTTLGSAQLPGTPAVPGMSPGASPVLVYDGSVAPSLGVTAGPNSARDADGAPALLAGGTGGRGLGVLDANSVRSTRLSAPSNTVVQGTLIPAVLETAIDTDVPGYVRAVVSQDVKSFDGSKVLIPRSSRLIGEYKAATQAGQRRAYLMWTRLVRPDGVSIALASPAADFSGQAGVSGQVNSHWFSRFGSAILLSVLGSAGTLATGGASTVIVGGAGQSAASAAIQSSANRGPTIKVQQGQPVRVFTARDLIFSDGADG